ncbi:MAG: hypothetical protein AAGF98_16665 [Cyanobacteria bacterium P01_H01_bin.153]
MEAPWGIEGRGAWKGELIVWLGLVDKAVLRFESGEQRQARTKIALPMGEN